MGKSIMSAMSLNKRKNDDSSNTLSSFKMIFLLLLVCAACGGAVLLYGAQTLFNRMPSSRLTYISNGVSYALNLQTGESMPMGVMQDSFYAAPLSPDQRWIATWEMDSQRQSYVVMTDAASQQPMYRHPVDTPGSRLSWSADSQWLVLSAQAPDDTGEALDLWLLHHVTGQMQRLTQTPQLEIDPTFSPDGAQIAYITITDTGEHHLYVMDLAAQQTRLLTSEGNADRPSWSPDGQWIAFEASEDGTTAYIEIIHPDGTGRQAVTSRDIYAHTPLWVP
jgi:dipeptidyl aminopeptidase/acylaminoacyl peptidase